jgi:hypothetical protein
LRIDIKQVSCCTASYLMNTDSSFSKAVVLFDAIHYSDMQFIGNDLQKYPEGFFKTIGITLTYLEKNDNLISDLNMRKLVEILNIGGESAFNNEKFLLSIKKLIEHCASQSEKNDTRKLFIRTFEPVVRKLEHR